MKVIPDITAEARRSRTLGAARVGERCRLPKRRQNDPHCERRWEIHRRHQIGVSEAPAVMEADVVICAGATDLGVPADIVREFRIRQMLSVGARPPDGWIFQPRSMSFNHELDTRRSRGHSQEWTNFSTTRLPSDVAFAFEDDNVFGFVIEYADAEKLLSNWQADQSKLLERFAPALRNSGPKAWNVYAVMLTDAIVTGEKSAFALKDGWRTFATPGKFPAKVSVLRRTLRRRSRRFSRSRSKAIWLANFFEVQLARKLEAEIGADDAKSVPGRRRRGNCCASTGGEDPMKIRRIELHGFRGFREYADIEVPDGFLVIQGAEWDRKKYDLRRG